MLMALFSAFSPIIVLAHLGITIPFPQMQLPAPEELARSGILIYPEKTHRSPPTAVCFHPFAF